MKNPNGFGSVFKLGGNRRKPWAVRITVGWTDKGKQKYKYLDYFATRSDAMVALAEYNKNPYDVDARRVTFAELYEIFLREEFPDDNLSKRETTRKNGYKLGFNHSQDLHELSFFEIRKSHMQDAIDNCTKGYSTQSKMKTLYNQLYRLALENDWVEKDYSRFVRVPRNNEGSKRKPFSREEINLLWENVDIYDYVDTVLIMIYTGMRPGELVIMENEKINIEERFMIGGIKTEAGENRIIPIHKRIKPLIERRMSENKFLLPNSKGGEMSYDSYLRIRWSRVMKKLGLDHKPHDCRHTFATMMDNAGANKISIKKIMGHTSGDVTDKVYTHKNVEELLRAVDLLE